MLSLHTSPLAQPGSGDSGGMNVYVRELTAALAQAGHDVTVKEGTVLVGTHADCAVRLTDSGISRRHVTLELTGARVRVVDTFPQSSHAPIIYPIAAIQGDDVESARHLLDLLESAQAGAVFQRCGFDSLTP